MDDRAELLDSRPIHDGRVVKLGIEKVLLPNGKITELEIIRHQGAAAVVPLDASGNVLLVRQYRHAAGGWLLEIPAGKLDPGETPEQCALRETEEEVGVKAGRLESLGPIWTTPGFTDERIWLFLATELEPGEQALEDGEALTIEKMRLSEAIALIDSGAISDSKSIVALLKVERFRMA